MCFLALYRMFKSMATLSYDNPVETDAVSFCVFVSTQAGFRIQGHSVSRESIIYIEFVVLVRISTKLSS